MNVLDLVAKLTLDKGNYESDMEQAEDTASKFGEILGTGLATAAKVGAAAIATVTAGVVALGTAIWKGTKDTAAYGDNVDKMSQKIGISAEAYQEWAYVMNLAGGSVDNLQAGMRTLSKVLVEAENGAQSAYDALDAVGLSMDDLEGKTMEEQLQIVIDALGEMEAGAERNNAAQQLLGRSAMDLAPLLNMTAEEIQAAKDEAHELGMIMSDEDVKASATMQDALTRFQSTLTGVKNTIFADFMPGISTMLDGFTHLIAGSDDATEEIIAGFDSIISVMTENVPQFLELAVKIVLALVDGIMNNLDEIIDVTIEMIFTIINKIIDLLPELAKSAARIIVTIVTKLVDMLPDIIDAAITIIVTLANAVVDALPKLIPAIVKIMMTIVEKLTNPETLMQLIEVAIQIIVALIQGLVEAIPLLIEYLPEIITNIVLTLISLAPELIKAAMEIIKALANGIIDAIPKVGEAMGRVFTKIKDTVTGWWNAIKQWGRDLIQSFVDGIKESIQKVKDAVANVGQQVKDLLGFSEPKEGPLSNFHTYAPDMMKLFAQGIKDNEDVLTAQIEKSFDISGDIRTATAPDSTTASRGATATSAPINITVQSVLDGRIVAESVYKYGRSQQRVYGR